MKRLEKGGARKMFKSSLSQTAREKLWINILRLDESHLCNICDRNLPVIDFKGVTVFWIEIVIKEKVFFC